MEPVILNELNLQKGMEVNLGVSEDETQAINIVIHNLPVTGTVLIGDSLLIESQYCKFIGIDQQKDGRDLTYLRVHNSNSRMIGFRSKNNLLQIGIELPDTVKLLESNIYIENISFFDGSERYLQTSVVEPGKIIFKDFDDKSIKIESHDFVEIGDSSNLKINKMIFHNDTIGLVLTGQVNELRTGTRDFLASRLPSVLEWIYNQQPFIIYLNTLILVATTFIATLQHMKITPKKTGTK